MKWMDVAEITEKYKDGNFRKFFVRLYAIRWLFNGGVVATGYKPDEKLKDIINLTDEGEKLASIIEKEISGIKVEEVRLALFSKFYHLDLLVDAYNTVPEKVQEILSDDLLHGRIRYPSVYGRSLYDRFYEMFPEIRVDNLPYDDTMKLLENQPQGILQIMDFVTGPFGILRSNSNRYIVPSLEVPLWHCPDPSCTAIHSVRLNKGECKFLDTVRFLNRYCEKTYGPSSQWYYFFREQGITDNYYYGDINLSNLPILLEEAFSARELQSILEELLRQNSREMREIFPKNDNLKELFSGSAEKISKSMNKPKCLQLILLMSDEQVARAIEELINKGIIMIPTTEVRKAIITEYKADWFDTQCEVSQFGIRSITEESGIGPKRLKRLIQEVYEETNDIEQLKWSLRHIEGETINQKLDRYIDSEDPKEVVKNLILISEDKIKKTFEIIKYGIFEIPDSKVKEEYLIDKLLWKLGFNIKVYPAEQKIFGERFARLNEVVSISDEYGEYEKEQIRSVGVNFFVSLEEILDMSLSFTTWVLLSDHFGITNFRLNLDVACDFMSSTLTGRKVGTNEIVFQKNGKNTLYPLIQGFRILADMCKEIRENGEKKFRRSESELPGYFGKTQIQLFPFTHKKLILDLNQNDYDKIVGILSEVTTVLEKGNICDIRNRIDHGGRDFPRRTEIEEALNATKRIIDKIEEVGICPLVYLMSRLEVDGYMRGFAVFKNYKGMEIQVKIGTQFEACKLPAPEGYLVIFPEIHMDDTTEILRFKIEEKSDFTDIWKDYPKRKIEEIVKTKDQEGYWSTEETT